MGIKVADQYFGIEGSTSSLQARISLTTVNSRSATGWARFLDYRLLMAVHEPVTQYCKLILGLCPSPPHGTFKGEWVLTTNNEIITLNYTKMDHIEKGSIRFGSTCVLIVGLLLGACDLASVGEETEYFYYYFDEKIPLYRIDHLVSIEFEPSLSEEDVHHFLERYDLKVFGQVTEHHMIANTRRRTASAYYTSYGSSTRRTLGDSSFIRYAAPVFRTANGNGEGSSIVGLTDEFRCRFADTVSTQTIQRLLNENHLEKVDAPYLTGYLIRVTKQSKYNALEMANHFHELPYVEFASPDKVVRFRTGSVSSTINFEGIPVLHHSLSPTDRGGS